MNVFGFLFWEKKRQQTATFLHYPISGICPAISHSDVLRVFACVILRVVCVFIQISIMSAISNFLTFFDFPSISLSLSLCVCVCISVLCWIGENEPVYSGRNLGSPGFGGPGGIFTYPSSAANSHHPVSDCLFVIFYCVDFWNIK